MYEHPGEPLLPRSLFVGRMIQSAFVAAGIILAWLGIGVVGYHQLADLSWIDSLLNASMIMSGMGPVDVLTGTGSKVFASVYAVLSGVVFLSTAAILITPLAHRLLHHFHRHPPYDKNNPARS